MSIFKLFDVLRKNQIEVFLDQGKLKTTAPAGRVTPEIGQLIRENKDELIEILSRQANHRSRATQVRIPKAPPLTENMPGHPLSYAQQRLWFIEQFEDVDGLYNIPMAFALQGPLDFALLQQTLDTLVERHQVLRTTFLEHQGTGLQVVQPARAMVIERFDIKEMPEQEQTEFTRTKAQQEATAPFDLGEDLMLRCMLIQQAEQQFVVLLTMHHIAADGWSTGILKNEFIAIYSALKAGHKSQLPPLETQYLDYSYWQREQLAGEQKTLSLQFWRSYLNGIPKVHSIPLDFPRESSESGLASVVELDLPEQLTQQLKSLAQQQSVSLYILLQTALSLFVSRWCNEPDVVIGSPVSGRYHQDIEPLIGFFVNTLVLRTKVNQNTEDGPATDFLALLQNNAKQVLQAFSHQHIPFEMLVDELKPERSLYHSPLFQILFSMEEAGTQTGDLPDLTLSGYDQGVSVAKYDLEIVALVSESGIKLKWQYDTRLFHENSMRSMLDSFAVMLSGIAEQPDMPVSRLPLVQQEQESRINATAIQQLQAQQGYLSAKPVHQVFQSLATSQPDKLAILMQDTRMSYRQLDCESNKLAHYLITAGVGKGDCVGVCFDRSLGHFVSLLALFKVGAVFVPLDANFPQDRIEMILNDADIQKVLTTRELASQLIPFKERAIPLDGLAELQNMPDSRVTGSVIGGSDLAYIIYTSGTTGRPKGVMLEHSALAAHCVSVNEHYQLTPQDNVLQFSALAFDTALEQIFAALTSGATLVVRGNELWSESEFADFITKHQVTVADFPPNYFLSLLKSQRIASDFWRDSSLRIVILGSDVFPAYVFNYWCEQQLFSHCRLINAYGPTETTITSSIHEFAQDDDREAALSIGKPLPGRQYYVVDANDQLLPQGACGELLIGGIGLAKGYLHQQQLTQQKFVTAQSFAHLPEHVGRLYRTGDLVRWSANQTVQFIGRTDEQVKIRGFRIELGEIENSINSFTGIATSLVFITEHNSQQYLVAYAEVEDGKYCNPQFETELKEYVARALPAYMVPSAFVLMNAFPMTDSLKIDRKALPKPQISLSRDYVAPTTDTQATLVAIWQDILDLEKVGIQDNFFELGGHSLLATRVVSEVANRLAKKISIRSLFEFKDIKALASHIDGIKQQHYQRIPVVSREKRLPLSFAQQRLWFIDRLEQGSSHYNLPSSLQLSGQLNYQAVQASLDHLLQRHEVLRTTYQTDGDDVVQVPGSVQRVPVNQVDLTQSHDLSISERIQKAHKLALEEAFLPFDLAADIMLRCTLIKIAPMEHVVLFTTHHIASDGWSTGILVDEFAQLYSHYCGADADQPVPLAPLPVQYADFASWQRMSFSEKSLQSELNYWLEKLSGAPKQHSLPLDFSRKAEQSYSAGKVEITLDGQQLNALKKMASDQDATLFMALHTALAVFISRWSNESDIVIGTPVAGRVHKDCEPLIGFFNNTLALRTQIPPGCQFEQLLAQVKREDLDAFSNQNVPFEMLVEQLQVERSLSHSPLFQIMLILQNYQEESLTLPDIELKPFEKEQNLTHFDLGLTAVEHDNKLQIQWNFKDTLFRPETVAKMAASFARLLQQVTSAPELSLDAYSLVPANELQKLQQWQTGPQQKMGRSLDVVTLFERQAAITPDAIAVSMQDESIDYSTLNRQANRLAHYFLEQGMGSGSLIAIYMPRSLSLFVAMLAVMKAGAAYIPVEPNTKPARLRQIIEDAEVSCLILEEKGSAGALVSDTGVKTLNVDLTLNRLDSYSEDNPSQSRTLRDSAYVIYTSGSTGKPKGVDVSHGALIDYCRFALDNYYSESLQGAILVTSHGFDISVPALWLPLLRGDRCVLTRPEQDLSDLSELLIQQAGSASTEQGALLRITPMHVKGLLQLLQQNTAGVTTQYNLPYTFVIGGERLTNNLARALQDAFPNSQIYNHYGPSETVVGCAMFDYSRYKHCKRLADMESVPIGMPMENTCLHVLDQNLQPVPVGAVGELYIEGPCVAKGYINAPALTAERFIPVSESTDSRMYRTGDLVRWIAADTSDDGSALPPVLMFMGRCDEQVKLRGYRIELGDIETVIRDSGLVTDCAAHIIEDEQGVQQLLAYLVVEPEVLGAPEEHAGLISAVKQSLENVLSSYSVPSHFMMLDSLPLNANGKLDRKSLPRPKLEVAAENFVAAETKTEKLLADIWAGLLKIQVENISTEANFFELGGDSILSIQIVSRAARAGLHFTVKDIFEQQTIKRLAKVARTGSKVNAPQVPTEGSLPLLPIQRAFFEDDVDLHHYNQAVLLNVPGNLTLELLQEIVTRLVERHDVLRLRFAQDCSAQSDKQGDWASEYLPFSAERVRQLVAAIAQEKHWIAPEFTGLSEFCTEVQTSLNLQNGPLMRAVLVHSQDSEQNEARLLLVLHHLIVDGVSWRILLDDIQTLFQQSMQGAALKLGAKTSSYQQWSLFLQEYALSDEVQQQRDYWGKVTQTYASNLLSALQHQGAGLATATGKNQMGSVQFKLDANVTKQLLTECGSAYRTQIQELLLAAVCLGIQQFCGDQQVSIDMEGHGRESLTESLDISETLGWFTSIFPVHLTLQDVPSTPENAIEAAICAVKEQFRVIPNKGIGYGLLKYIAKVPELVTAQSSVLSFNYLGQFDQSVNEQSLFSAASEGVGQSISSNRTDKHLLSLVAAVISGEMEFSISFRDAQFSASRISALMQHIEAAIGLIIEHCLSQKQGRFTPSDFPLAKVTQSQLDNWIPEQARADIEDLYPATGMQNGLLFHSMVERGSYTTQTRLRFEELNVAAFKAAWQAVFSHQTICRTGFVGLEEGNTHQLVYRHVELPWREQDISHLSSSEQQAVIERITQEEKSAGFDFSVPPLIRIVVLNLGQGAQQMIWSHHHALLDGWSTPLVYQQVVQCYSAICQNEPLPQGETAHYRDYVAWLQTQDKQKALAYWQTQVDSIEHVTPLPLLNSHANARAGQSQARTAHINFAQNITAELETLAKRMRVTMNILVQAAWATLLSRHANQSRVAFGATTSGRPAELPQIEQTVGLFINTLPVVADIPTGCSLETWLQALHQSQIERDQYQYVPLHEIQRLAADNQGLFNSILVFENYPVDDAVKQDSVLKVTDVKSIEGANYAMALVVNKSNTLNIRLEVDAELFNQAQLALIAERLELLILSFTQLADEALVSDLDMMRAEEKHRLIHLSDAAVCQYPDDLLLHQVFENIVREHGSSVAVMHENYRLTYDELNQQANQLAHYLREQGVGHETPVGILMPRSHQVMIAILAVLKAGGTYVPLDPGYPTERLSYMMQDAEIGCYLVCGEVNQELKDLLAGTVINMQEMAWQSGVARTDLPLLREQSPRSLANIIYTSGSTGKPKGVMVPHGGCVNLAEAQKSLGVTPGCRVLQFSSMSFDAMTWEWLMALTHGAALYVCPDEIRTLPEQLSEFLVEHKITNLVLPPSMLQHLPWHEDYAFTALVTAGEALNQSLADVWATKYSMFNAYGPTETSVCASVARVKPGKPVTIGKAIANTRLYAVDDALNLVPPGAIGQLCVAGDGVTAGYLNKPELTQIAFVADPFYREDSRPMYKTGDLVRLNEEEEFEYIGRLDTQVKIRGFRIEVSEIESALNQCEGVRESIVVVRTLDAAKRLIAYVVPEGEVTDEAEYSACLKNTLKETLPAHMVPSALVCMSALPLTVNFKVDKKALPMPKSDVDSAVTPRTEQQQIIAQVWQELLGIEQVGLQDNFFEIGGDSILAIQVVSRCNARGLNITTKQLVTSQTIEALASQIEDNPKLVQEQGPVSGELSLLPIQRHFLEAGHPQIHHFNQSLMLQVPESLTAGQIEQAIQAILERHDALRLQFWQDKGNWKAEYLSYTTATLQQCCITDVVSDEGDFSELVTERANYWQRQFDLASGNLFKAVLIGNQKQRRLLLVAHHLVVDGVSWRIILSDLQLAINLVQQNKPIELAAKTSSLQKWGAALRAMADSQVIESQQHYWRKQVCDNYSPLVTDFPIHGSAPLHTSRTVTRSLSKTQTHGLLKDTNQAYRTQINELLLSALSLGVAQWRDQQSLIVALEGHGRDMLEDELDVTETVGWFTCLYPLRLEADKESLSSHIKQVKETCRSVPGNGSGYGILRFIKGLAEFEGTQERNEPDILFNYLGQIDQSFDKGATVTLAKESDGQAMNPDMNRTCKLGVSGKVLDGQLQLSFDYSELQFERHSIKQLANLVNQCLLEILQHCAGQKQLGVTPSDFPLARVSQPKLDGLFNKNNQIQALYPATPMQEGLIFHSMLEKSAYVTQNYPIIRGNLIPAVFRKAWLAAIARHDVLRTAFIEIEGQWYQQVSQKASLPWCELDWSELDEEQQKIEFEKLRIEDRAQGFDFQQAPVMRITMVKLASQRHQILWTHHHSLLDGWSLPVLFNDVLQHYAKFSTGLELEAPKPASYQDYIRWLQAQSREQALTYWQQLLSDVEGPTELVFADHPVNKNDHLNSCSLQLGATATAQLKNLTREMKVTMSTLLQFAWGCLLHKYSQDEQVIFGTTISGRPAQVNGIEQMVGLFINTVPVVMTCDERSIAEIIYELQEQSAHSNDYGYLSLLDIQQQSCIAHGDSLFLSVISVNNYPLSSNEGTSEEATDLIIEEAFSSEQTHYNLLLNVDLGDSIDLKCTWQGGLFSEAQIQRILGQLQLVLSQLPELWSAPVRRLSIHTELDYQQLQEWQNSESSELSDLCIHQRFEQQVLQQPLKTALTLHGKHLSYAELNRRANKLAHYLQAQGVASEDFVGIFFERSFDMIVAILAILKASAAYVPLDPNSPKARLQYIVKDSGIRILLSQQALHPELLFSNIACITLDEESHSQKIAACNDGNVDVPKTLNPCSLAYMIYTSGSTGDPKGVMIEHRNVIRLFDSTQETYNFSGSDVWSLCHSIAFDFSVWEVFGALLYGGRLVIVPSEMTTAYDELYELLVEQRVTVLNQTPAAFNQLSFIDQKRNKDISLRAVIFGGEALVLSNLASWVSRRGDEAPRLYNMYGITETTVHVTCKQITGADIEAGKGSIIGRAIDDLSIYLLDSEGQPVLRGSTGEMYVGGPGVARGYWNNEALNESRFVRFAHLPEQRLYRSGDIARYLGDGEFEYLGRCDDQVKVRGFRIELGEIEQQIIRLPEVKSAAVLAPQDEHGQRYLVAYVVAEQEFESEGPDGTALGDLVKNKLAQVLPEYMVPPFVMFLPSLPLTGNGKLDRKALPKPQVTVTAAEYVAPETETELAIAEIWSELLAISAEELSIEENFFDLGGHSLLATKVLMRIEQKWSIDIAIRELFQHQTIKALSSYLDGIRSEAALREEVVLDLDTVDETEIIEL